MEAKVTSLGEAFQARGLADDRLENAALSEITNKIVKSAYYSGAADCLKIIIHGYYLTGQLTDSLLECLVTEIEESLTDE